MKTLNVRSETAERRNRMRSPASVAELQSFLPESSLADEELETIDKPPKPALPSVPKVSVLGVDLSHLPRRIQFSILASSVCIFFLACGLIEEQVFKRYPGFNYGWFLTLFELFEFALCAGLERYLSASSTSSLTDAFSQHNVPLRSHLWVAIAMTGARGLTNWSLEFLNYPTQVIFKSLKLLSIMIGSCIIMGKRYSVKEVSAAAMLVMSAALFSLGDVKTSPNFNIFGIVVVSLSLVGDAFHANYQERVMKDNSTTNTPGASMLEVMVFSNFFAACITVVVTLIKPTDGPYGRELLDGAMYLHEHWPLLPFLFTIRTLVVYAGALCYVCLIRNFGAVTATTVTTVRKILTIVSSFIIFPKPFSSYYVLAGALFFVGLVTDVTGKSGKSAVKKTNNTPAKAASKV